MKNYNMILTKKQQIYQHCHRYLIGEEILPFNQNRMIQQAKLMNSSLEKGLGKQTN